MAEKKEKPKEKKPKPKAEEKKKPVKEEKPKEEAKPIEKKEEKPPGKEKPKAEEEEKPKIIKESMHTIPLRKAFSHPKTSRVKYAVREIKDYLRKHTRKEPVVDPSVNEALWGKGIQKPPRRIQVKIQETEDKAIATKA